MRLRVDHRTTYRFEPAMRGLVQSLRLTPSLYEGQQTIDWSISVEGATAGAAFRDGAGDWVETRALRGPVSEATVIVAGEIETVDLGGVLRGHRERVPPEAYLTDSPATEPASGLHKLSLAAIEGIDAGNVLDRAHALSRAVTEAVAYVPGETHPATTAAEALELGQGVCQDQTHVLIAIARAAGIPARYVTGYLFSSGETEDGPESAETSEASHAWAELYVPSLGWIGFDPSNETCPDERYIRLGSGIDAQEAAPIRGVAQGAGEEELDVTVEVSRLPSPTQAQSQTQQ